MRVLIVLVSFLAVAWTPFPTAPSPDVPLARPLGYISGLPPMYHTGAPPDQQFGSDVASDGRNFFAVSNDQRYPQSAMLLDERGEVTSRHSVQVSKAGYTTPAVAWSGRNYLVVWEDDGGRVVAARYTAGGQRIDAEPVFLRLVPPSTRTDESELDAAWDGSKYVVVINTTAAVHIGEDGRILANNVPVNGTYIASREGITIISPHKIAAGEPGFFIVYLKNTALYGRALDAQGNETGDEILVAHNATDPAVTWNGTHWLVAWIDTASDSLYAIRQDIDHSPRLVANAALRPGLASNGTSAVITWQQYRGDEVVAYKAVLDAEGGIRPAAPLQRWASGSMPPAMTRIGTTTLVVWQDATYEGRDFLRTQPVVNGVPLTAHELELEGSFALGALIDVASNGVDALVAVAMFSPRVLHLFRVGADGAILRRETIAGQQVDAVRVVWTGSHYGVIWDDKSGGQSGTYRAVRVAADGSLIDGVPRAVGRTDKHDLFNPNKAFDAAVASDGTILVHWTTRTSKRGAGVFLSPGFEITQLPDVPVDGRILDADVASDGRDFLLVYHLGSRMVWARASRDGAGPLSFLRTPWSDPTSTTATTTDLRTFWTGENYLVVDAVGGVYAFRIAPDGTAIDNALVHLMSLPIRMPYGARRPAVTFTENRSLEFAYLGVDANVSGDSLFYRSLMQPKRRGDRRP